MAAAELFGHQRGESAIGDLRHAHVGLAGSGERGDQGRAPGHRVEYGGLATPGQPDDRYVPSVDRLFETAAKKLGEQCIGVVLTGMGDDGADGVLHIARRGGRVLAESPESAVIYGMPGAAERTGVVTAMLPLETLAERLVMWLR